jgi:uncharacterized protein
MSCRSAGRLLVALVLSWAASITTALAANSQSAILIQDGPLDGLSLPLHTLKQLRLMRAFRRTWHQQYDYSCGSAAVATLLTYQYDRPTAETTIFKAMFAVGDQAQIRVKGFSLLDMKRYLESLGYVADGVRASLDTLNTVGIPAIALIADRGYRHFVVVKGLRDNRVLIGDPALGRRILSRKDFEAARVGNLFFVIRNQRQRAHFNLPADWNSETSPPLSDGVSRSALAEEFLSIPDATRF